MVEERYVDLSNLCQGAALELFQREQTNFVETDALKELLKIAGNLQSQNVTVSRDDGVTQEASARAGVASLERVNVPPKWELSAWRTFIEVEQPSSYYLLRLSSGHTGIELALYPVVDAAWSVKAMERIKKLISIKLGKGYTVIA